MLRNACQLIVYVSILQILVFSLAAQTPQCVTEGQAKLAAALAKKPLDVSEIKADAIMCVARNRGSAAAMRHRALVEYESGEWALAAEWYSKAIAAQPGNADGYYGRAAAYLEQYRESKRTQKDLRELAVADLDKALELDPTHAKTLIAKARLEQDENGPSPALMPLYDKAISVLRTKNDPRSLAAALARRSSLHGNDYRKAFADLTEAIKLDPTNYQYYQSRAGVRAVMGDTAGQIQDLTAIINSPEPTAFAYSARALIYERSGDVPKALADNREALKLAPNSPVLKQKVAGLEAKLQAAGETGSVNSAEAHGKKGREHAEKGEYEDAIRELGECIRLKPEIAGCYMFLGGVYAQQGKERLAIENLDKAIDLAPSPAAYWSRATVNMKFGKKAEAVADLRSLLKLDPANARAKQALQQLGIQP